MAEDEMFSSVHLLSHVQLFATPWTAACQAFLSITNSQSSPKLMSMSQWCHPTISSSVVPVSFHLQSFPASGSFQMSQFFTSGGQSIGVSASASVIPMNVQDWFPLGWTGWISLPSKELSRVVSMNSLILKHIWRRLLRVPCTARRTNQSILKEISPEYSLEGQMLKLKLQYFGHLMWRTDSFERTLMLGMIELGV